MLRLKAHLDGYPTVDLKRMHFSEDWKLREPRALADQLLEFARLFRMTHGASTDSEPSGYLETPGCDAPRRLVANTA